MSDNIIYVPDFTDEQIKKWEKILQNDQYYKQTLSILLIVERISKSFTDGSLVISNVSPASFTSAYYHAFWLFDYICSLPNLNMNAYDIYYRFLDKAVNTRICYIKQLASMVASDLANGKTPLFSEEQNDRTN